MDQIKNSVSSHQQKSSEPDNRKRSCSEKGISGVKFENSHNQDPAYPKLAKSSTGDGYALKAQKADFAGMSRGSDNQNEIEESFSKVPTAGQMLVRAAKYGDLMALDQLLEKRQQKGNQRSITQNDLNTALLEACKEGRKFIVQRLVRSGADVNTRDNERCTTPLHVAAQQNFVDIADFLLDRHADINASDWQGNSALILAVHRSGSSDILNLLLSHGAKIDHKNSQSVTALMKAVEVMDIDAIKILMLSGSDVQHKNGSGLTARDIAAENGIADVLGFLEKETEVHLNHSYSPESSCALSSAAINNTEALKSLIDCRYLETKVTSKYLSECKKDNQNAKITTLMMLIKSICSDVKDNKPLCSTKLKAVKILVGSGIDAERSDQSLNSCLSSDLINATQCGIYEIVELLCNVKNISLNSISFRPSALMVAAETGRLDILQLLINAGADPTVETWGGEMALTYALKSGYIECANFLLQKHKPPEEKLQEMAKAVVQKSKLESLRFLISHCIHINETCQKLVEETILTGDLTIVQFLVDYGADIHGSCDGSYPTLLTAIENRKNDYNKLAMVKFLVENGSCVNRMPPRDSPLVAAMYSECIVDIPRFLLEHGANVNEVGDKEGNTPLHAALKSFFPPLPEENRINTLMAFIKAGADPNKANCDGNTALHLAACSDDLLIVEQLIDAGAHLEARNSDGKTPMLLAAGKQQAGVILLLKKCGADMKAVDNDGKNAVFQSVEGGYHDEKKTLDLQLLASDKDQVDIQMSDGLTPLILTAKSCDFEAMEILLKVGADPHKKYQGDTALGIMLDSIGQRKEALPCVKLLIRHGALLSLPRKYCCELYRMIIDDDREMVQLMVTHGMAPIGVDFSIWKRLLDPNSINDSVWSKLSALAVALLGKRLVIARYLVQNWFLTPVDLVGSDQIKNIRNLLESEHESQVGDFLNEYTSQPMSLLQLSFVVVSAQLGESFEREERVRKLPIPAILQDSLLFKREKYSMDFNTEEEHLISDTVAHTFNLLLKFIDKGINGQDLGDSFDMFESDDVYSDWSSGTGSDNF